jgi:hypothetical protein
MVEYSVGTLLEFLTLEFDQMKIRGDNLSCENENT